VGIREELKLVVLAAVAVSTLWSATLGPTAHASSATQAATAGSEGKSAKPNAQVHIVITDAALREDSELPPLQKEDIKVKQGKNFLDITQFIPAQGDNAALQLMILIDDTLNPTAVGNDLNDIRDFISALPAATLIGVGYMSNAGVQIAQNFTLDHDLVGKAIRLPRGSLSSMDSSYLSLISLVKGWTQQKVRREVLIVSDGVDRLRGEKPQPSRLGPDYGPVYHTMPTISIDANSASEISQRYNVVVFPLYSPGVGRAGRSGWDLQIGLSGLTKIANETGGECFSLSTSNLVSFKPYLDRLQKLLNNQYYLVFNALPGKKDSLQRVTIQTATKNSEILAPDNVWVPGASKTANSKSGE
jgi:hypothetical protein